MSQSRPGMTVGELFAAWGSILTAGPPCFYRNHPRVPVELSGMLRLRRFSSRRREETDRTLGPARRRVGGGVLGLVKKHRPLHVSLVGGEPMIRHRELSRILPALSQQNIFTMVVTSGIIPIPAEWMGLRRNRVAVSIDGLPEHHDPRRKPATYERILENIRDREVNIHWTITGPMMKRPGYLEEYLAFWQARPEVKRIWVSLYSPS